METSSIEGGIGPDYGILGGESESLTHAVKGNDAPLGSGVLLKVPHLEKVVCLGKETEDVMYNEIQEQRICLENTIVDQTETHESESIKKVENQVLKKEEDDFENVLALIPQKLDNQEAAFMLGETCQPTSLQYKPIEDKIQMESCIEHLDNQGEQQTSGSETVIDTVAEKDTDNTLLVQVVDIRDETDEQPGVPEQQAVKCYDKPFAKVSEYIGGAATDEHAADLIKQGQSVIAVEETLEEQREGSKTIQVDEEETNCTEEDRLLTAETGGETKATNNKDFKKLQGNLNEEAGVNFTSIIPEAARLPNVNATEQENTSETKMPEESTESEVGNITLSTQYDNIEGKEMQTTVSGTSATKELNVNAGEDVKQVNNFTGEKDEYHGTESTIQEDSSVDKNFHMSRVKDEAIDIGDNENPAVEKYPKHENINEKSSTNSENLISEDEKEQNKLQIEDVQQESLAEDLISQCDNTTEKKVQIDTSDDFNENDRFEDTLPNSMTEKVTEGYQDNEKEAKNLSQEVVDKTNEKLSISSSNAKHETGGEEDVATESASNENKAQPSNYHIMIGQVSSISGNITSRDDSNEEDNLQEEAIEEFIHDDQIKGTSLESPLGKMDESNPDDAREANELTEKNLSAISREVEAERREVSTCSSIVKDRMSTEAENENLSRLDDQKNNDGETNSLMAMEEVANVFKNITSQDGKIIENVQMEDVPQESEVENIIYQSENSAETYTKHTSEEFKKETDTSPVSSAKEYSDDKQAKELSKEIFQNLSTVTKEAETEHSDLSPDISTEKYETTAEGKNENLAVEEYTVKENVVGGHYQDDDTEVTTIQLQDVSPEPFEDYTVSQFDKVKSNLPGSLTENLDKGYLDDGKETKEAVDTETEDLILSSSTAKYITSGEGEYLDLSRVEDEAIVSGENDLTAVEPPKHENIMEESSTISGNKTYLDDNNEENMMQAKDVPTAPVEENMVSQYSNMEEKFLQDTTEVFTEDGQVKATSPEPPQEKLTESDTDDGKETSELPEKKLWSHSALSKEVDIEHEDLGVLGYSPTVKDQTNAEAENENLSGLEGEISDNGNNMSLTTIEEVPKISENIIEEEKIHMEDVSQESLAEKIISPPENTAEKATQIEHPSHESTVELGTSPDSPADEISEEYLDHREAKQLPEEISENLSILSKEIKTDNLDQIIYPSIDENETTAAGENEKLAVEELRDDKNIVGPKSATFHDDNTELKITQLEDASPEPMEENFVTQTTTEDDPKTEETSRKFTEDEYVKGCSAESSVAEGHIEEDEEGKKQFPEEKYENLCKEIKEEGKEHDDLIHDTSKCEMSPGGDEECLKVQEHPKDEQSTKASTMTANTVVQGESSDEEKIETEDISKNFAEDGHVTSTSTETSFEKIVESNIDDVKDIDKFPEKMSANGGDEHLTWEASPEEGKIIEEASPVAVNLISQDNENEEKETRMEGTNAQSPDESNLVDTAPESLAEGKAESHADDVHEAMEGTSEQYKEESNLEETLFEPLAEKEADISNEGKGFTEDLKTMGGESFAVEYSAVEGEHEDLDHDSSTLDHAIITMEDNEEVIVENKLKEDDNIAGAPPISAGNTIHQENDSIDAVNMHQEDRPKTSMEGSTTPLDDNEGQNADEKSTEASCKAGNKVSWGDIADEKKTKSEQISKIITEDDPQTGSSTETSFEKIVDSNIDIVEVIEEFPEEMSANEYNVHWRSDTSPEDGKLIEEECPVAVNIISRDNENEEKEMQMESTNAQGPDESNVDTPPETLAGGKAENSTDDVHEAMEGTREQYKEESNLEHTPSEPLAEKEAETSTDDGHEEKEFTEELTTGGGSLYVEHAVVDREHEDLDHELSITDHATVTKEDNEEVIIEKKLKEDDNITGESPISAGNTIHQKNESIDAVKMHQEDGPKTSMEGSATPLDDNNEGQNADEKSTEASSKAGNKVSREEIADEKKTISEHISKIITEDDPQTGTSTETSFEKTVDSNIDNVEVIEEFPEEMSANEYNVHLRSETSPEDRKIIEEACPVAANIISRDNENEEKEMQMESTNAQGPDESNVDTPETLAGGKIESSTDDVHEPMERTRERYKEESNLEDTPSAPLVEKEAVTSTDDGHEEKGFTEELTTGGGSLYVEHAAVDREHEDLDHDLSITDHATVTMEDNEEVIAEEKLKVDDNIAGEALLFAGNSTIHQEDAGIDAVKIHLEDGQETSMEGSANTLDVKTSGQKTQIQDSNEELIKDEDATCLLPRYPSEDVLQTSTDKEKECISEQKRENLLTKSTEIEKDHEDAVHDSSPVDGTAKEYVKLTADETMTNEITTDGASSSIMAEVIHNDTALNKAEEFLPITLSPDDKGTGQKAQTKDKIEQATDTVKEINELADLYKFENDNDQLEKEKAPEVSEEITEEYNMETDQEELKREYHTGPSPESPYENKVEISCDDGKRKNELNEENTENHSVEDTAIGEVHEDLSLQTSCLENVTSEGENNEFEKEEMPEKEKVIDAKSLSAAKNSITRDYNNEEKMEIEDVTYESVEGSTMSEDYNAEEKDTQKDDISQPIEGNHATVTSAEVPIEADHETYATDENKVKENIIEECEILTAESAQEYNEMLATQKDTKEETVQVSSAIIGETLADNIALNNNELFLSTDSSNEGEGTEQTSMKDMAEDKIDTKNEMKEQNDQIQREDKEKPAEIMEQEKIEEEAVTKVIEGVEKEDLESPAEEYEESASRETAEGILIAKTSQLEETTITLSTEEDIVESEKKICQELTDFSNDKLKYDDAKEDMATEDGSLRNSSLYNREDAFHFSGQEEGNEKLRTDEATFERSESINIEVHQDPQTDEDINIVENSKKEVNFLSEPVVDVATNSQRELESKTQETRSIEETELFTTNDQQRETDNGKVSEENFGKANADERITEQCKELDSFHKLQSSERGTVSEKATEHVEASSLAATGHAADDDDEDHEESFSLGQKVSGKHNADEEEHDVPDEAPDAKEKKEEEEEEESASSATQLGEVVELSKETNREPIEEVKGGTPEAIERNNEALVAKNKDVDYQEDESKKSDTEMFMTSEGQREADLTDELHEHHDQENTPSKMTTGSKISKSEELDSIVEGKEPVKSNTTNNSSMLKDGENQEDSAIVKESALQTGTISFVSEQDRSFSAFNRSILEVVEVEKSASAAETNQQCKDSKYRIHSLLADESLELDGLGKNIENSTSAGNEETSEELSKHPFDSTIEDATEERQRNDEVTQSDGRETKLEVLYAPMRKEDDENELTEAFVMTDQEPIEHEDEIKEEGIHETEENQNDANDLQRDEIKTFISTESYQNEEQKMTDLKSITGTEPSTVAETVDECLLSKGQSSDCPTKIEKEFPEETIKGENLESDIPVEKHENEITVADNETNEKSSRDLSDSTTEEIQRNEAVAQTLVVSENQAPDDLIMADQAPVEPESVDNVKNIHENAEYQIDNDLQHDENLESATLVKKHENKTATVNEEANKILSKHPADVAKEDVTEEKLRCEVTPTEETETKLDVRRNTDRGVNEDGVPKALIMTSQVPMEPEDFIMTSQINQDTKNQVPMEPENEEKDLTSQEAAENVSDADEHWHNEIKSVASSESVQIGNEQAPDSNHIHEIESSEKVDTLYNNSETSTVDETFEEFDVLDETCQSSENNTKGKHQLRQRNKENLGSANLAANLEHETTDIYEETNGKLTKHPASSTEEDMKTGRLRSEVTPTEDIKSNSKVVMEPENEEKSKGIQELSEKQKEVTEFQQDEIKSVTSSTSLQNVSENATNFDKIYETEILEKMGTPFNQSEASAGANTLEEADLSDVVEGETVFESHTSFQDVGEIRQDGMGAKEIHQPTEVEEQLQETLSQLVPVEEKPIATVEVIGETVTELKPLPNVREEQQFSELVLHEQKYKDSLLLKDIKAEENTERFQSLEGETTAYSVLEQIKDEKCLQEEVPKVPDTQSLDFKTSKKLHLKEETTQETSTTDSKIIMQARDFSTKIQCTGFSQAKDSEKTTEEDTSIYSSLEETKDDEKAQATIIMEEHGHLGKAMLQSEENSLATLQTDSTGKHKGEENWHVLSVEDALVSMEEAAIEEEQGPEEREKKGESMPTGETLVQSSEWHQVSAAEMNQMEGYSSKEEIVIDEEDKIGRSEAVEKEADVGAGDLTREDTGSVVEASKDIKVKATQKKSHNILSGVGSKVKHSISKVKKAITGKPSQPKNTSPKKETTPRENI